ncbi:MAG TPA: NUDIX domain-containing protein [Ktedonobacterales bacterium]
MTHTPQPDEHPAQSGTVDTPQEAAAAQAASNESQYERPSVTVDIVLLTVRDRRLDVLLVKRRHWPDEGRWALPGGFVNPDETLEAAAARELQEETGVHDVTLHQLHTFGEPGRDPRGWVISVAHVALVPQEMLSAQRIAGADDAADAAWFPAYEPPPLAFDHARILDCALNAMRIRLDYMPLAHSLLPQEFTMGHLRAVYSALLHHALPATPFRAKVLTTGLLEIAPCEGQTAGRGGQALYRFRAQIQP